MDMENLSGKAVSPPEVAGRFEAVHNDFACGWALGVGDAANRLRVEIVEGSEVVAIGEANQPHQGLRARNIGDGRYAFLIRLPASLFDGQPHVLRARDAKSGILLQGEQVIARRDAAYGEIEGICAGVLFGWLPGGGAGKAPVLEIRVDGRPVGTASAHLARQDIVQNEFAASACGFRFDLGPFLTRGLEHEISLLEAASGREIAGSPVALAKQSGWGVVDSKGGIEIGGWVVLADAAAGAAVLELEIDGSVAAEITADRLRADLRGIGLQQTRCGFSCVLPPQVYDGRPHALALRLKGSDYLLRAGAWTFKADLRHRLDIVNEREISGWILNAAAPDAPIRMDVWVDGKRLDTIMADHARDDVAQAVLGKKATLRAGFFVKLPEPAPGWKSRSVRFTPHGQPQSLTGKDILILPRHEVIRHAERIARADESLKWVMPEWIAELRKGYAASHVVHREIPVASSPDRETPVDVIVPVYKGTEETLACVRSVLNARDAVNFELIVINDASPEPSLTAALRQLAEHTGFTLLENAKNLGFVATVNGGMKLHPGRDVILLNSDTVAPRGDWISRLRRSAYAEADIATVTPFSNRATICSLPRNLYDNEMPLGQSADALDALCAQLNPGVSVKIPTGIGFCIYIKRAALIEAGLFDEERWAKGYGEENDFCIRSAAMGWKHVAACDVFVQHHGSVSFQAEKDGRVRENLAILNHLYPDYPRRVEEYLAEDPLAAPRAKVVVELLRQRAPRFLVHVTHKWGGGIDVYVRDLCRRLAAEGEATLILRPGEHGWMELATPEGDLVITYPAGTPMAALAEDLRKLNAWHLHFHQTIGLGEEVWGLPEALGVRFDYTVHDYYLGCPRINLLDDTGRFCGQPDIRVCESCTAGAPLHPDIEKAFEKAGSVASWRELHRKRLEGARRIFAPSKDAQTRFRRFFDAAPLTVLPHPEEPFKFAPKTIPAEGELRVALIGAIGPHKGHDMLLRVARLAKSSNAPVRFVIVGYTCDDPAYRALHNVDILGPYKPEELHALLASARCDAALFLSPWPETYSYTLTEAWRAKLVPITMHLGAQAERVRSSNAGVVLPENATPKNVLDAIVALRSAQRGKPAAGNHTTHYRSVVSDYYALKRAGGGPLR